MRFWFFCAVINFLILSPGSLLQAMDGDEVGNGGKSDQDEGLGELNQKVEAYKKDEKKLSDYRRVNQFDAKYVRYWLRLRKLKLKDDRDGTGAGAGEIHGVAEFQGRFFTACIPHARATPLEVTRDGDEMIAFASPEIDDFTEEVHKCRLPLTKEGTISVSDSDDGWNGEGDWQLIPRKFITSDAMFALSLKEVDTGSETYIPENRQFAEVKINFEKLDFTKKPTALVKFKNAALGIEAEFEIKREQYSKAAALDRLGEMREQFVVHATELFVERCKSLMQSLENDIDEDALKAFQEISAFLAENYGVINSVGTYGEVVRRDYLQVHKAGYAHILALVKENPEQAHEALQLLSPSLKIIGEKITLHANELLTIDIEHQFSSYEQAHQRQDVVELIKAVKAIQDLMQLLEIDLNTISKDGQVNMSDSQVREKVKAALNAAVLGDGKVSSYDKCNDFRDWEIGPTSEASLRLHESISASLNNMRRAEHLSDSDRILSPVLCVRNSAP